MKHTRIRKHKRFKKLILSAMFIVSFGLISSGMLLCLMQSPSQKAVIYLTHATHYYQQASKPDFYMSQTAQLYMLDQAHDMALRAITQTPYDMKIWNKLSQITKQSELIDVASAGAPNKNLMSSLMPEKDFALLENINNYTAR